MKNSPDIDSQVLMISRYFPPDGQVGGRRIHRFSQYLPEYGIQPHILTYPKPASPKEAEPDFASLTRVEPWPNPMDLYGRAKGKLGTSGPVPGERHSGPAQGKQSGSFFFKFKDNLGTILQLPDTSNGWYFPASKAAKKLIRENGIETILTSGPPWTCHLIGRKLKKQLGVKWLADFRDPWTAEVMDGSMPHWRQQAGKKLESSCVHLADRIICTTEEIQRFFGEHYPMIPREKFIVIPNGFEPIDRPKSVVQDSRRLLLHVGNLYGTRRIDTFAQAVKSLVDRGEIDPSKTRIMFLGDSEERLVEPAKTVAPELFERGIIELHPKVAWQEAQRILWGADVHLIFQGKHTMQIPAKFFECLQTGAPILAVAEPGALTQIVRRTHSGVCADSREPEEIEDKLRSILRCSRSSPEQVKSKFAEFQWRAVTGHLADVLSELRKAEGATIL